METKEIIIVHIGRENLSHVLAELNTKTSPMLIIASDDKIEYNGAGVELTKEQEQAIIENSIRINPNPNNPELLKKVTIETIPYEFYDKSRKSDNQPWAKCNRRGKFHK